MHKKIIIGGIVTLVLLVAGYVLLSGPTAVLTEEGVSTISEAASVATTPTTDQSTDVTDTIDPSKSVAQGESIEVTTGTVTAVAPTPDRHETALLANGCFWCAEADLEKVTGVTSVVSGYAGGTNDNPTYENHVASGHREVVLVTYNPSVVTFGQLVEFTIKHGDPTDPLGSFNDRGPQYAPAIYFATPAEEREAKRVIAAIDALKVFKEPLPLAVLPRVTFYPAEAYHQDYAAKNSLKYSYYRLASGRSAFIENSWGDRATQFEVTTNPQPSLTKTQSKEKTFMNYQKPTDETLRATLSDIAYTVTQKDGTEKPFANEYDSNYEAGIYVDVVSGEPLFLSTDKYDSGTGWPSFVKPITPDAVVLHEDNTLFTKRTEVRSRHADSHLGHVFEDGPSDRGGMRYCMNSAALRFIPTAQLEEQGYGYLLPSLES